MVETIKLRAGKYMRPVHLNYVNGRIELKFGFNRILLNEIKNMKGARWHGYDEKNPRKIWTIDDCQRNKFQLAYLQGLNPYKNYDSPLIDLTFDRSLYQHQITMISHILTRKCCIIAGEMGVGKTLAAIEAMERSGKTNFWCVAPKSALKSVKLELEKWHSKVQPCLITYAKLRNIMTNWEDGVSAPEGVIFDESSRIKNATAQRSQAAQHLADAVRKEHDGYVILMSGSPSPKSPVDWHNQCEVAMPGFLKEGDASKFKRRLGLIVQKESITGAVYPHIVTWRDDEKKCNICGELKDSVNHMMGTPADNEKKEINPDEAHMFVASVDEVSLLYKRMKGLVYVIMKKDCLDLPDKIYRTIICKPKPSTLRVADTIAQTATSTIKALIRLRELSDGFQYEEKVVGTEICELCHGEKLIKGFKKDDEVIFDYEKSDNLDATWSRVQIPCPNCNATGEQNKKERITIQVPCPKDDAIIDLLDEHDEIGRIVIYAGFTGSIDRLVTMVKKQGWAFIRVDGRGWIGELPDATTLDTDEALKAMDASHPNRLNYMNIIPRLAFIANPGSGGMGLTLTASPSIIYYSNDFNAESRIQSEDRIHRAGMDENRHPNIIDLFHLPSDEYVLRNLQAKRRLEKMTLGDLQAKFK